MRRSLPPLILLLALLALPGCVALIEPSAAHVHWTDHRRPGTTQAELDEARTLYLAVCTECHRVRSPLRYEPGEWTWAINRMLAGEDVRIEPAVIDAVALYLSAASALPDAKAVEAYLETHPELAAP